MAVSQTEIFRSVYGNTRVSVWQYSDSSGENVEHNPGFGHIDAAFLQAISGCSALAIATPVKLNALTAATSAEGFASITAIANGDKFNVLYIGR